MLQNVLQPSHLLLLLAIVLLVVGTKRLPETARSLGRSIREFRGGLGGGQAEPDRPAAPPADERTRRHR
jgi:sec-independent protein translocase protein TatA